ncbi:DUF1682-domain-containing protein [Phlebopus sp. FC_14]|nr:DUF1682-domain-containing protein [Phlebopus sp. FC_14]
MAGLPRLLLLLLSPPPFVQPEHYDGLQYVWKFFVFRPALLRPQACLVLVLVLYVLLALYGKHSNTRRAHALSAALLPLLRTHFSAPTSSIPLISDGHSDFFIFSTGRRALASLHSTLTLRPRHDPLQILWQCVCALYDLRYGPVDVLTLDFAFDADTVVSTPDFVWAVVSKRQLSSIKDSRWDLTFTRTTDHPSLPPALSVMSEFADVTDALFNLSLPIPTPSSTKSGATAPTSLPALLSTPSSLSLLRSLSITDQPSSRPSATPSKQKRVVLSLQSPSPKHAHDVLHIIDGVFALVDAMAAGKLVLRPETRAKIKKVREDLDKEIKAQENREKKQELTEDRKAAKRKAEEERVAKLSAAEQKKILERDRKRVLKKSQGKVVRKS